MNNINSELLNEIKTFIENGEYGSITIKKQDKNAPIDIIREKKERYYPVREGKGIVPHKRKPEEIREG